MHGTLPKSSRDCRVFTSKKRQPDLAQVVELVHCGRHRFFIIRAEPDCCIHSHLEIWTGFRLSLELCLVSEVNVHPLDLSSGA
jgi:hypothetical protein